MRFAILIGLYVVLNSVAQLLLKQGASAGGSTVIAGLPINARLVCGVILFGLSFLVWIFILAKENLSFAFPFAVGLGYSTVAALSIFVLKEPISAVQMTGIVVVLVGLTLIALR